MGLKVEEETYNPAGKRGYFRVDDSIPLSYRRVSGAVSELRSRVFGGYGLSEATDHESPDEAVSPRLWKILSDIDSKLNLILERLNIERSGLAAADSRPVNISASGIRFPLDEKLEAGDIIEIKMLLPLYPSAGVLLYGRVVRVAESGDGKYEAAVRFMELEDDVLDVLIQYALKRQRELMRRERNIQAKA